MKFVLASLLCCFSLTAFANSEPAKEEKKEEEKEAPKAVVIELPANFISREIQESHRDIELPKSLVAKIENLYVKAYRVVDPYSAKTDSQLILNIPRKLFPVKVTLEEKTKGVLKSDTVFSTPNGGGIIDLKEVLTGKKGTYYVKFYNQYSTADTEGFTPSLSVFFISKHKKRKIDGKMAGMGCDQYADITRYFKKENSKEGFRVNTTDGRHITVLGGTFVFVVAEPEALNIALVQFQDSRLPDLTCSLK